MNGHDRFFVLTGGPGAGKTTLLDALAAGGLATAPEAGRAVIRMQQEIGGTALPWVDRMPFAEMMLAFDMRSHDEAADRPGPVLFDRAIPDLLGYLALEELPVPDHFRAAAALRRYNRLAFILPPWREIYRGDAERRQDWGTAVATHDAIAEAYRTCGYELCAVPFGTVEERCRFVRARLESRPCRSLSGLPHAKA